MVVASGRFQSPCIPTVPGLDTFAGVGGSDVHIRLPGARSLPRQARSRRGRRDQRARDRLRTRPTRRRTRRGDPTATALRAAEVRRGRAVRPPDLHAVRNPGERDSARRPRSTGSSKRSCVEAGGSPEQYGAPAPDPSLFAAGVTLAQQYLPLVAEGRITVRPWLTSVDGRDGDVRRRITPRSSTGSCSAPGSSWTCRF